jgi:putative protein kinase ArgK-like GTPase of G3E family
MTNPGERPSAARWRQGIADIVVIHKADLPGAAATGAQVQRQLDLPGCCDVSVVRVSAREVTGLMGLLVLGYETVRRTNE